MRAPSGKNGSNGCFSVFTVQFSVHQVLTSHLPHPTSHVPMFTFQSSLHRPHTCFTLQIYNIFSALHS